MQLALVSLLGTALTASAAIVEARGADIPAQCAWNGYTKTNFKGTVTKSQSIVQRCVQITNPALPNDLESAKVTLGPSGVCLYEDISPCTGRSLLINASGNKNLLGYSFKYWKCGSCLAD